MRGLRLFVSWWHFSWSAKTFEDQERSFLKTEVIFDYPATLWSSLTLFIFGGSFQDLDDLYQYQGATFQDYNFEFRASTFINQTTFSIPSTFYFSRFCQGLFFDCDQPFIFSIDHPPPHKKSLGNPQKDKATRHSPYKHSTLY